MCARVLRARVFWQGHLEQKRQLIAASCAHEELGGRAANGVPHRHAAGDRIRSRDLRCDAAPRETRTLRKSASRAAASAAGGTRTAGSGGHVRGRRRARHARAARKRRRSTSSHQMPLIGGDLRTQEAQLQVHGADLHFTCALPLLRISDAEIGSGANSLSMSMSMRCGWRWHVRARAQVSARCASSSAADALAAMRSRAAQAAARSGFVDREAQLPSGEPLTFLERPPVSGGTPASVVVFLHGMCARARAVLMLAHTHVCAAHRRTRLRMCPGMTRHDQRPRNVCRVLRKGGRIAAQRTVPLAGRPRARWSPPVGAATRVPPKALGGRARARL